MKKISTGMYEVKASLKSVDVVATVSTCRAFGLDNRTGWVLNIEGNGVTLFSVDDGGFKTKAEAVKHLEGIDLSKCQGWSTAIYSSK